MDVTCKEFLGESKMKTKDKRQNSQTPSIHTQRRIMMTTPGRREKVRKKRR